MRFEEFKEVTYFIRRLNTELHSYKEELKILINSIENRLNIIDEFRSSNDLFGLIKCGEIFDDIKDNYIDYLSVCETKENANGEIIDIVKVYVEKAEKQIVDTEIFLFECEEEECIDDDFVNNIRKQLQKYKSSNIFDELRTVEEILLSISNEAKASFEGINNFIISISEYNSQNEIYIRKNLNEFCYQNIDNNSFVKAVINIQNNYNGTEVIHDIIEVEAMSLFSIYDNEKLKAVLQYSSECYFTIRNLLNQIQQLSADLLNIDKVKKQIDIIEEFLGGCA